MKNLLKFSMFGLVILICFSWTFNVQGVYSADEQTFLNNSDTRNIVYTKWIDVPLWYSTIALGRNARGYQIDEKNLKNVALDKGKLLIYSDLAGKGEFQMLPTNVENEHGEYRYDYIIEHSANLKIVAINLRGEFTPVETPDKFRCLYVPNSILQKLDIDLADYESVKEALALVD